MTMFATGILIGWRKLKEDHRVSTIIVTNSRRLLNSNVYRTYVKQEAKESFASPDESKVTKLQQ